MYFAAHASRRRVARLAPRSRGLLLVWLSLAAPGLAGCSDDPAPAIDAATVNAEIGTGMFTFERLVDGQPLDLIAGPQGGFHFVVHARMRGLTPGDPRQPGLAENPTTYFRVLDEDGARVDVPEVRKIGYASDPQVGGWYALPSGRILLIDNTLASTLYGRLLTIELQIQDAAGRMAGDAARITAVAFPPDAGPGRVDAGTPVDAGPGRVDASIPVRIDASPPDARDSRADRP